MRGWVRTSGSCARKCAHLAPSPYAAPPPKHISLYLSNLTGCANQESCLSLPLFSFFVPHLSQYIYPTRHATPRRTSSQGHPEPHPVLLPQPPPLKPHSPAVSCLAAPPQLVTRAGPCLYIVHLHSPLPPVQAPVCVQCLHIAYFRNTFYSTSLPPFVVSSVQQPHNLRTPVPG